MIIPLDPQMTARKNNLDGGRSEMENDMGGEGVGPGMLCANCFETDPMATVCAWPYTQRVKVLAYLNLEAVTQSP